jgi:hypothetical protein
MADLDDHDTIIGVGGPEVGDDDAAFTIWASNVVHGLALGSSWMVLIPVTALLVRHFRYGGVLIRGLWYLRL